ncbi:patatin-like phospholipase family protein [Carboxydochorda subterranea]|uniref:Patatin-like phospholipase family protein n=1 Tax=Carboxydichorda subterranea TaxID=3109565 RepID=A0ABZ1BX45_9FIRM|nr:patatin-like phospholipase family protein [Limnochorda sp. L945t]WRP17374.1 patatin-like phospholipase family protein [Limnochorda sp. L945t]
MGETTGGTPGAPVRLGLALGGGGARGLAHIGVVRAILRAGIPIHVLTGTSMGAIVAVAFALGDPERSGVLQKLEEGALRTPLAVAPGERETLMSRLRRLVAAERILTSNVLGWGSPLLGDVMPLLNQLTRGLRLEDAPIRVGVVATDLETGERVVLTEGNAALAAMASAALPMVFPPVRIGKRLLVDGGFVELVPVQAARELGADVVVAVDVSVEKAAASVKSGLEALIRAAAICSRHHTDAILEQADLILRPRFSVPIDTLDFDKSRQAIEAGLRAGREALPAVIDLVRRRAALTRRSRT